MTNPFLERYKDPSTKYLDTSIIAKALGVRECKHPLDGGTIHTRGFVFDDNSPLTDEQQVVELLRPLGVRGVYTCELIRVMDANDPTILKTMLKVRAIYK